MKQKILEFDDDDLKTIDSLQSLGLKRCTARVLVFLDQQSEKFSTSLEIELGAQMRQPEVSIAMNYLHENGWIIKRKKLRKKSSGKGRPMYLYKIKSVRDILDSIEKQKLKELEKIQNLKKSVRS